MRGLLARSRALMGSIAAVAAMLIAITIAPAPQLNTAAATDRVVSGKASASPSAVAPAKLSRASIRPSKTAKTSRARKAVKRKKRKKLVGKQKAGFVWPVAGPVTSRFGTRVIFGKLEPHRGMDIACSKRQAIRASKSGRVIMAQRIPIYGKIVVIKHRGGYSTLYAHMRRLHVDVNERVNKREAIGKCGETGRATGPHLHFEIRRQHTHRNPRPYLSR